MPSPHVGVSPVVLSSVSESVPLVVGSGWVGSTAVVPGGSSVVVGSPVTVGEAVGSAVAPVSPTCPVVPWAVVPGSVAAVPLSPHAESHPSATMSRNDA